jgi:adenylate cyclase
MKCVLVASKATLDAAGSGVVTGKREMIKVKGKDEAIDVFEILGLESSDGQAR